MMRLAPVADNASRSSPSSVHVNQHLTGVELIDRHVDEFSLDRFASCEVR